MTNRPLTVCTWLWRQPGCRTRYTAEHVNVWARMIRRNLVMTHRLVCLTDDPTGIDEDVDCRPIPDDFATIHVKGWSPKTGYPQCYRRLAMFRRDIGDLLGPRFVSMDLDCIVFDYLDPLFTRTEDIVLFRGTGGRRPYNGSMILMDAGARPHVYEDFTVEGARHASQQFLGSDQAWIAYALGPNEARFRSDDGCQHFRPHMRRQLNTTFRPAQAARVLFFPGRTKPWDLLEYPAVQAYYR